MADSNNNFARSTDEGYYDKFLRAAGQNKEPETLSMTLTFPSDRKTLTRWAWIWFFIQICSSISFMVLIYPVLGGNVAAMIYITPPAAIVFVALKFQLNHNELHKKLYARLMGREGKDV